MSKGKEEILAALDMGSTNVTACVAVKTEGKPLEIIGVGTTASKGIKKGCVVDIESTAEAISAAVEAAEEMADVEVNSVFVNIAGNHIKSFNSVGSVPITSENYEITEDDQQKAVSAAKAVSIPLERMVLQVVPQEFSIDGQSGIKGPVGMSGHKLEVGVHIITAKVAAVQNIVKCLGRAHLEYDDLILGAMASASSVLTPEEKEMGAVMIDLGGGTADIAVYVDGSLKFSDVFPCGGNQVTNDVAVGLRLPFNKAEEIKKHYGSALRSVLSSSEEFAVPGVLGRPSRNMLCRDLASIIEARAEEIFLFIKQKIENAGYGEKIGSGVVLCGGSSVLRDLDKLAQRVFNVPVRIGKVRGVGGMDYILESPSFATSVGLLIRGEELRREKNIIAKAGGKNILSTFSDWFKKLKKQS